MAIAAFAILALLFVTEPVPGYAGTEGRAPVEPTIADSLPSSTFLIRDVRLFDGLDAHERVSVLVRDGRIERIAAEPNEIPYDLPIVEGAGRALIPGLIDAHTHTFDPRVLTQSLSFGVTLHLDMFTAPAMMSTWRAEQAAGGASGRADIIGPGYLATPAGGHGTQFGLPVPTVDSAEDAEQWTADRVAEGADFIKIIVEGGGEYGLSVAKLDAPRVRALVDAARAHGLRTVAHVSTVDDALMVVDAGVDGLAHLWVDRVPTAEEVHRIVDAGLFVIPTAVVLEGMTDREGAAAILADDELAPYLDQAARQGLELRFPEAARQRWEIIAESMRMLHAAGVPLLAGSDAPNPGTTFGASVHREMELLVEAGLTPTEALAGATGGIARAFGLDDRGRVVEGARADFLLVDGDPTREIRATRRIVGIWKEGRLFDREAVRSAVAATPAEATDAPRAELVDGRMVIGDFEDGTLGSAFGIGWAESSDPVAGGGSTAALEIVRVGADATVGGLLPGPVTAGDAASTRVLRVTGEVDGRVPFAWAGTIYMPGAQPFAPADLSRAEGIAFLVRGSGPAFQVTAFSEAGGMVPATVVIEVTEEWSEIFLPWSAFGNFDPSGVLGIAISAGPAAGAFEFHLDRVTLR